MSQTAPRTSKRALLAGRPQQPVRGASLPRYRALTPAHLGSATALDSAGLAAQLLQQPGDDAPQPVLAHVCTGADQAAEEAGSMLNPQQTIIGLQCRQLGARGLAPGWPAAAASAGAELPATWKVHKDSTVAHPCQTTCKAKPAGQRLLLASAQGTEEALTLDQRAHGLGSRGAHFRQRVHQRRLQQGRTGRREQGQLSGRPGGRCSAQRPLCLGGRAGQCREGIGSARACARARAHAPPQSPPTHTHTHKPPPPHPHHPHHPPPSPHPIPSVHHILPFPTLSSGSSSGT